METCFRASYVLLVKGCVRRVAGWCSIASGLEIELGLHRHSLRPGAHGPPPRGRAPVTFTHQGSDKPPRPPCRKEASRVEDADDAVVEEQLAEVVDIGAEGGDVAEDRAVAERQRPPSL